MKNSPLALLAAFLLLLSACGANDSAEISASEGIETTPGAVIDDGAANDGAAVSDQNTPDIEKDSDDAEADAAQDEPPSELANSGSTLQSVVLATDPTSPQSTSSAEFEASISLTGAPGSDMPGQFSLQMAGAYDLDRDASRMSIDMSDLARLATESGGAESDLGFMAAFLADDIEMVTIGDRAWIKWGLLTMFTGAGDKWLESTADTTGDMTADIGIEGSMLPTELLDVWADTPGDVQALGVETIRGVEATHYRFTFDADELATVTSDAEWAQMEEDLGINIVGIVTLDVWSDEAGLLHRYVMDLTDPDGDEVQAASFTFEIWGHGSDIGIEPPAAEDVITEDELTFGFGDDDAFGEYDEFQDLSEDFES
jgi:hypothetical protein